MSTNKQHNDYSDEAYKYQAWMTSFIDLLSILIVFFILIYAISGSNSTLNKDTNSSVINSNKFNKPVNSLIYLKEVINNKLQGNIYLTYLRIDLIDDLLVISPNLTNTQFIKQDQLKSIIFELLTELLLGISNLITFEINQNSDKVDLLVTNSYLLFSKLKAKGYNNIEVSTYIKNNLSSINEMIPSDWFRIIIHSY